MKFLLPSLFLLSLCCLWSCQSEEAPAIVANFETLTQWSEAGEEQIVGVFGGSGKKKVKPVETKGASFRLTEEGLQIAFEPDGRFQFAPKAADLPASWLRFLALELEVETEEPGPLLFEVYGSRTRLIDTLSLEKGEQKVTIDITEVPLLGGIEAKPLYIRISSAISRELVIRQLSMDPSLEHPYLVDRWGQRARKSWSGKVGSLDELTQTAAEQALLEQLAQDQKKDPYGGFTEHNLALSATGFFHTQFVENKWWLVTPDGNPFYSLGVNGVRIKSIRGNADVSRVKGREWLFEEVPSVETCPECFREEGTYFSYYAWNVKRKYESLHQWRQQSYHRLRTIGFNTIGNWSDTIFYQQPEMPYTYTLDTRKVDSLVMSNGMPDVFHPAWEEHLHQTFGEIKRFQQDPFLLGYFVDNEMSWRSITKLDSNSYTGRTLAGLSSEEAQRASYAERYFASVRRTIEQFDDKHLYLGCRFTRNFKMMETVAQIAGQYLDVLSINVYAATPIRAQMDQWYGAAQKPILLGEHHIPPITPKQLLPHWPAFSLAERNEMVENYVYTWLDFPYALGSHWYQYKDQEVAGRGDGGENQPVGLVTVSDQLNEELVRTYHKIGQQIPNRWLAQQANSQ